MADRTKWIITGPDAGGEGKDELTGVTDGSSGVTSLQFPENHTDKDRVYNVKFMDANDSSCVSTVTKVTVKACGTECECGTAKVTYNGSSFFSNIEFAWDYSTSLYQSIIAVPVNCIKTLKVGAPGTDGSSTYETTNFRCVVVEGTDSKKVNLYVKGNNTSGSYYEQTISIIYTEENCSETHRKTATLRQAYKQDSSCTSLNNISDISLVNYESTPQAVVPDVNPNGCMAKVVKGSGADWLYFRWCNNDSTYATCGGPDANVEQSNGERYLWVWPVSNTSTSRSTTLTFTINGVSTYSQTVNVTQTGGDTCSACYPDVSIEGVTLGDSKKTTYAVMIATYSGIKSACANSATYEFRAAGCTPSTGGYFISTEDLYFNPATSTSGYIYAKITSDNTLNVDRTNTFSLYLKSSGMNCKTFTVTQPKETVTCGCDGVTFGNKTLANGDKSTTTKVVIGTYNGIPTDCLDWVKSRLANTSTATPQFVNMSSIELVPASSTATNGNIKAYITEDNDTGANRANTIQLYNGGTACASFTVTQPTKTYNCSCNDGKVTISAKKLYFGYSQYGPSVKQYVEFSGECFKSIDDGELTSETDEFFIYVSGGKIHVFPMAAGSMPTTETAMIVTYTYNIKGGDICYASLTAYQEPEAPGIVSSPASPQYPDDTTVRIDYTGTTSQWIYSGYDVDKVSGMGPYVNESSIRFNGSGGSFDIDWPSSPPPEDYRFITVSVIFVNTNLPTGGTVTRTIDIPIIWNS